jgi:MYXO-CTERM domain-containing protein
MSARTSLALAPLAIAVAVLSTSATASAYCRTSSCLIGMPHNEAVCDPPQETDCGTPIAWPMACTEFSIQEDGSKKLGITVADMETVMSGAFATWEAAACTGGGHPLMAVSQGPTAVCAQHEYNQDEGNANVIMFHDDSWPYDGTVNTLALTTVTYDIDNGQIYDADMELNSAETNFTLGDTNVDYDLRSIVQHESGHFLGLAHSADASAVMWPSYNEHTTSLRTLTSDDVAAICATYPPGPAPSSCDPTPRHGFSALCGSDQPPLPTPSSGCSVSAPSSRASMESALAGVAILGLVGSRRRRSRSRPRRGG